MKKILFGFLMLLVTQATFADTTVPESIQHTFVEKFPQASNVTWIEQQNGLYEADFTLHQHKFAALLDKKGSLLHSGETLNWFDLPAHVRHAIGNDFQGFKMKLMIKENGEYFAEFSHQGSNYLILFNNSGKARAATKD